ncbi:MAG: hypothetical protein U9N18_06330 [Campylobacterota bacterium]|nr:hypothetical protein [Campylobacterota bacterium]
MKKGAVAFIDILGFKGMWQRKDIDVMNILNGIPELIKKRYRYPPPEKKWPSSSEPQVTILSDTIVITIDSEQPHCLFLLGNIINEMTLYFHEHKMFFRGAIGYGEYIQSGNTFVGPAIDDVASWYEVADWIGIVLTPKSNYIIDRFSPFKIKVNNYDVQTFIKYDVSDKYNNTYHINCLNWPGYLQAAYEELPNNGSKSKTHKLMVGLFTEQGEFDALVLKKYENTLKFVDYAVCSIELKTDE